MFEKPSGSRLRFPGLDARLVRFCRGRRSVFEPKPIRSQRRGSRQTARRIYLQIQKSVLLCSGGEMRRAVRQYLMAYVNFNVDRRTAYWRLCRLAKSVEGREKKIFSAKISRNPLKTFISDERESKGNPSFFQPPFERVKRRPNTAPLRKTQNWAHRRPKQPLDVGELEFHIGRAAMVCTGRRLASPPSRGGGAFISSGLRWPAPIAPSDGRRKVASR